MNALQQFKKQLLIRSFFASLIALSPLVILVLLLSNLLDMSFGASVVVMGIAFSCIFFSGVYEQRWIQSQGTAVLQSLRQQIVEHLLNLPMKIHQEKGNAGHWLTQTIDAMEITYTHLMPNVMKEKINLFLILLLLCLIEWRVAIPFGLLLFFLFRYQKKIEKKMQFYGTQRKLHFEQIRKHTLEYLEGIESIFRQGTPVVRNRLTASYKEFYQTSIQTEQQVAPYSTRFYMALTFMYIGSVVAGFWLISPQQLGSLVLYEIILFYLLHTALQLKEASDGLAYFTVVEEELAQWLKQQVDEDQNGTALEADVTLSSFTFQRENYSLQLPIARLLGGDHIMITGETGAGKTTVFQLIYGLLADANISINNHSVSSISPTVKSKTIHFALQHMPIYSGAVKQLLIWANRDATEAEMMQALKAMKVDFLGDDPLENWIGKGGRQLSGGEQQRIRLAQAYLSGATIYLMDEMTSALDQATELEVLEAFLTHKKHAIVLFITHHTAIKPYFNRFFTIENGNFREKQELTS
ncbi:ATP-binding cassette domain-containing protein [Lysinibacillus sp. NPDC093190]|uniref:ATP-binding cassette domain-containing protein n=1 Tax=Lysinibacillus sp. NPDC093190 TaxID=3390575 RepID=UPI003D050CD3